MPIFSRLIYESVKWRARRGRYLRRHGYVFVARNYVPRGAKGEIDMVGFDGETLAFVEVRTRTAREDQAALPELSVTAEKQYLVGRTARRFYRNVT